MRRFCSVMLMLGLGGLGAVAQSPGMGPQELTITSTGPGTMDMLKHAATWQDNVHAVTPGMNLTCAWLVADKLPVETRTEYNVVATTNVVIDFIDEQGKTNHATCDRAVYHYQLEAAATNETVTLTGNAKLRTDQFDVTGEPLVWDMITKKYSTQSPVMHIRLPETNSVSGHTNHSPLAF